MTTSQRNSFYFPAWRKCALANDWVMEHSRLVADLDEQREDRIASPALEERIKVIDSARALALQDHSSVTADSLRHACNWLVSGGATIHTEAMTNNATTMAVRLFNLLADPDNLDAVMIWLNPAEADRRDYAEWLGRMVPEGTLIAISRNAWQTVNWRDQDMDELRWLARTATKSAPRRRRSYS